MIMIECDTCPARIFSENYNDPDGALDCDCPNDVTEDRPYGRSITITVLPGTVTLKAAK